MNRPPDAGNDDLTDAILEQAIEVHRRLGPKHNEAVYRDALEVKLDEGGFEVAVEVGYDVRIGGEKVGDGVIDLLVEQQVALELKAVKRSTEDHFRQLGRHVDESTANRGLLLNFGQSTLEIRRYVEAVESRNR